MNAHKTLLLAILLLGFPVLIPSALAADFNATNIGSSTINISTNYQLNITVTNQDASDNITQVNLTMGSFVFIPGTNSSSNSNATFSNSTSVLTWTNSTGLINTGETHSFVFNVTTPSEDGYYNITVNVTDTSTAYNVTTLSYSVLALFSLTFNNYTVMQRSSNTIQNLSYNISVTNNGAGTEIYNLSVVDCVTNLTVGVGNLNAYSLTLGAQSTSYVQLNVSNSTAGLYSLCIMANHWNGTSMNASWNFTSAQNGKILNSSFYPDLAVPAVYWTSTGGANPFAGGNITVLNATLNNTGHFNFTGNLTVYLLWDGVLVDSKPVQNTSLGNGTSYNVSVFSNITGIANGLHNLTVWVDALGNLSEPNENNNNYTAQVFVGYNVTILNVTGYSGANVTTGGSLLVNVSVKYGNGENVPNLTINNFTVYDFYNGSLVATASPVAGTFNSSMNASGVYWFNMTAYSVTDADTLPGTHSINVSAHGNESGRPYSGNSTASSYYLVAPRLVVTLSATSYSMSEGSTKTIYINVTNTGTYPVYNVTLSAASTNTDYLTLGSLSGCTKTLGNNVLNQTADFIYCTIVGTAQQVSEDSSVEVTATASGNHSYAGTVATYTKIGVSPILLVNNIVAGGTPTDDGDGGGATTRSCTTDASCTANETCSATKICTAISCSNGEILDHMCIPFNYKINITSYEPKISAISGGSNSTKVTVKNTGGKTFAAKLEVTLGSVAADASPLSYSLDAGESYQFSVNFTVPNTTSIGSFSGTLKAYVAASTGTYETKAFTFVVLPKEETKLQINDSYQELLLLIGNITSRLDQAKASGRYNQSLLAGLEGMINATDSALLRMKGAMDTNDYVTAQSLVSQINASINDARLELEEVLVEGQITGGIIQGAGIWLWVAVAVIIIFVVGFFVYMFYPSSHQDYRPGGIIGQEAKRAGLMEKVKRIFSRKKGPQPQAASTASLAQSMAEPPKEEGHYETFHYSEGYKKERSYGYDYRGSGIVGGLLQKIKRKKQKKGPQMHIDQFAGASVTE